jgi:phospholipid/cholesterol/gamma-HCH transport system substrate-binding protein
LVAGFGEDAVNVNFERWGETILGAAVAVVAVGFFIFASAQAGASGSAGGYELRASFQQVNGIGVGSDVRISGVKVGVVRSITLDPNTYYAVATLSIDDGVQVLDDSTARVATDGLLGGAYVSIEPGGMDALAPGAEIPNTQGSVDLLELLGSFGRGSGSSEPSAQEPVE